MLAQTHNEAGKYIPILRNMQTTSNSIAGIDDQTSGLLDAPQVSPVGPFNPVSIFL